LTRKSYFTATGKLKTTGICVLKVFEGKVGVWRSGTTLAIFDVGGVDVNLLDAGEASRNCCQSAIFSLQLDQKGRKGFANSSHM